jgi:hypothetical protein
MKYGFHHIIETCDLKNKLNEPMGFQYNSKHFYNVVIVFLVLIYIHDIIMSKNIHTFTCIYYISSLYCDFLI